MLSRAALDRLVVIASDLLAGRLRDAGLLTPGAPLENPPDLALTSQAWWEDCLAPAMLASGLATAAPGGVLVAPRVGEIDLATNWERWRTLSAGAGPEDARVLARFEAEAETLPKVLRDGMAPQTPAPSDASDKAAEASLLALLKTRLRLTETAVPDLALRVALLGRWSQAQHETIEAALASAKGVEIVALDVSDPSIPGRGDSFDLILARDALGGTDDLTLSLQDLKARLPRHGLLILDSIIASGAAARPLLTGLSGWRRQPVLDAEALERRLTRSGFSYFFALAEAEAPLRQIVVAESDGLLAFADTPVIEASLPDRPAAGLPVRGGLVPGVRTIIAEALQSALRLSFDAVAEDRPFAEYGLDSLLGVRFVADINRRLSLTLRPTVIFEQTSATALARHIVEQYGPAVAGLLFRDTPQATPEIQESRGQPVDTRRSPLGRRHEHCPRGGEIAVIGMSGQFPQARSVDELWNNLVCGREAIGDLPPAYLEGIGADQAACRWGGALEDRDCFDPLFFNLSPADAGAMSPHQRLVLQESWRAIEDAGHDPRTLARRKVGVFVGAEPTGFEGNFAGASEAIVAARISYFLNLQGPALVVNTGCSSSAMALHMACESLRSGETEACLAGGVNAALRASVIESLTAVGMLSPTGHCRTFDAAADGTVISEAVGMVMLKRLGDALRDGDMIHGVISASGANQDGASNGIIAPNGLAQERLILDTYARFGVQAADISYLEAHGTGTRLGDPVEVNALVRAYRQLTPEVGFCRLGSIKSAMGHASAAAGVVGLIKLLLCLREGRTPGQLNLDQVNPLIELEGSAFQIQQTTQAWQGRGRQGRLAALSSFGHSGTNVHLVVREPPPAASSQTNPGAPATARLVPLSARSEASLVQNAAALATALQHGLASGQAPDLLDLAWSTQVSREPMPFRLIFQVSSLADLLVGLAAIASKGLAAEPSSEGPKWWIGRRRAQSEASLASKDLGSAELAVAWSQGAEVDWAALWRDGTATPRRVRLPTYRFERTAFPVHWRGGPSAPRQAAQIKTLEARPTTLATLTPWWSSGPLPEFASADPSGPYLVIGADPDDWPHAQAIHLGHGDGVFEGLERALGADPALERIIWIAPPSDPQPGVGFGSDPGEGVLEAFRLVTGLAALGLDRRPLVWTFVTERALPVSAEEDVDPTHSGVHGLAGVISREFPRWRVCAMDVDLRERLTDPGFWRRNWGDGPESVAIRGGLRLTQTLAPVRLHEASGRVLREGGAYVVVGGAGGLGEIWSEHALRTARAQLIWIGRRARDAALEARLDHLARLGPRPVYLQADARDGAQLRAAFAEATRRVGRIDGVVNAAVGAFDVALNTANEGAFRDVLSAKVDVSRHLANICAEEDIGLLIAFSSLAAINRTAGMAGYAAGCVYKDSLAHSLARRRPGMTVKVINWGFWNAGTGLRVTDQSRTRWRNAGVEGISAEEGMAVLDAVLGGPLTQVAALRTSRPEMLEQARSDLWMDGGEGTTAPIFAPAPFPLTPEQLAALNPHSRDLDQLLLCLAATQLAVAGCGDEAAAARLDHPFAPWVRQTLRLIGQAGIDPAALDGPALWHRWEDRLASAARDKLQHANLVLLDACVRALPEVLSGRRKATEVLFPGGAMTLVEGVYKTNTVAHFFNQKLAGVLESAIAARLRREPERPLRILEVGAGTGGTTEHLLPLIDRFGSNIAEYLYTDISRYFLAHAMDSYTTGRPAMAVGLLDIAQEVAAQGLEAGAYDIVLATNALHATRQMRDTLANAKSLLRPGGILLVNEISETALFAHLTFGLLDGWWATEDPEARLVGSPGLAPDQWRCLLELEGYRGVSFPLAQAHHVGHQLIVATSDGVIRRAGASPAQKDFVGRAEGAPESLVTAPTVPSLGARSPDEGLRERCASLVLKAFSAVLKMPVEAIDPAEALERYGVDSLVITELTRRLEDALGPIDNALLFDVPHIDGLIDRLAQTHSAKLLAPAPETVEDPSRARPHAVMDTPMASRGRAPAGVVEPIAIIGVTGQYPGAQDLSQFWENLRLGRECVGAFDDTRWDLEDFHASDPDQAKRAGRSYSMACGLLESFAAFDAGFFGISPAEAINMDPQERLLVQCCWHVLEDAGYTREALKQCCEGDVGVFVGVTRNGHVLHGGELWRPGEPWPFSSFSSVANRISYLLDLKGPSMPIDTMCSSSLTAIHEACAHLRAGECDMAIAGGVNLYLHPSSYIGLCADRLVSTDGQTRSFGAGGTGFVPGEGVGAVLLKRLSDALRDNDHIHATVLASTINHGGRAMAYATPNPTGQAEVVTRALARAGLQPHEVSYVEGHGTGTEFGDAIEVSALARAYGNGQGHKGWCALGSCKPNIGHLEAAAGIAAVTKVILQMRHGQIAPSLHSDPANPRLRLETTPFRLQGELAPWAPAVPAGTDVAPARIAAVSAFGAAGSNAHVILKEHRREAFANPPQARPVILPLSARDPERLGVMAERLAHWLEGQGPGEGVRLQDVAWTLQIGREAMAERLAVVASSLDEAVSGLRRRLVQRDEASASGDHAAAAVDGSEAASHADLAALAQTWETGLAMDWAAQWVDQTPRRIPLPLYPFEPTVYWRKPSPRPPAAALEKPTAPQRQSPATQPLIEVEGELEPRSHNIEHYLLQWASRETAVLAEEIARDQSFFELGLSSASLVRMLQGLEAEFGLDVEASAPFEHRTIDDLTRFLSRLEGVKGEA